MRAPWPSIPSEAAAVSGAFAAGAVAGWGRPGADWVLLSVLGLVALFSLSFRATTPLRALGRGIAFGAGECAVALLGAWSWGAVVPITFSLVIIAARHAPLAVFGHWARGALGVGWGSAGVLALAVVTQVLGDAVGLSQKIASPLAAAAPFFVGGARLVGADYLGGVVAAACFWSACRVHARAGEALAGRLRAGLAPLAAGAACLGVLSLIGRATAPPATGRIAVGVAQVNAESSYYRSRLLSPAERRGFAARFEDQLRRLDAAELVVTTETYDGAFGLMFPSVRAAFQDLARRRRQALFVTSYLAEPNGRKSNAVAAFDRDGALSGIHRKVQLAPFGETALTAGEEFRTLPVLGVRVGVLVCLESYLAEGPLALVAAGANLLVATTSDVTFGTTATAFEHLAGTELRAVEVGRDVVWASNAGPSGVIDRWGKLEAGPFRRAAAIRVVAETYAGITPYVRFRALWIALAVLLFGAAVLQSRRHAFETGAAVAPAAPGRVSRLVAIAAGLGVGAAAVIGSAAMVALRHGAPGGALHAIQAALRPSAPLVHAADPYAPFRAEKPRAADGAVAYLLTYYGLDTDSASVRGALPEGCTVEQAAAFLEQRYGLRSRPIDLGRDPPPALAWLGSLRDGSVVAASHDGAGAVHVFAAHWKRVASLPAARATELLQPRGYVPVWTPINPERRPRTP